MWFSIHLQENPIFQFFQFFLQKNSYNSKDWKDGKLRLSSSYWKWFCLSFILFKLSIHPVEFPVAHWKVPEVEWKILFFYGKPALAQNLGWLSWKTLLIRGGNDFFDPHKKRIVGMVPVNREIIDFKSWVRFPAERGLSVPHRQKRRIHKYWFGPELWTSRSVVKGLYSRPDRQHLLILALLSMRNG